MKIWSCQNHFNSTTESVGDRRCELIHWTSIHSVRVGHYPLIYRQMELDHHWTTKNYCVFGRLCNNTYWPCSSSISKENLFTVFLTTDNTSNQEYSNRVREFNSQFFPHKLFWSLLKLNQVYIWVTQNHIKWFIQRSIVTTCKVKLCNTSVVYFWSDTHHYSSF